MTLLTTSADVAAFCQTARTQDFITLDTEFLRETTYWPQLCLIQVGLKDQAVAIDPLVPAIDLRPVWDLLADQHVLKVFHACKQDLELFLKVTGRLPTPIFDTQIAAMMLGYGEQVGYEKLIQKVLGRQIDKTAQYSDWAQRPLDAQQLAYALGDVTHLHQAYAILAKDLADKGRRAWVDAELRALGDPRLYRVDPKAAWARLKIKNRSMPFLAALACLAEWRERFAQERDLPRGRVLRDDILIDLAMRRPTSAAAMAKLRGLSEKVTQGKTGAAILAALARAAQLPADQVPSPAPHSQMMPGIAARHDMLRTLLKVCADQAQIAPRALASAADLEALARDSAAPVPCLQGWRHELFGARAQDLLSGHLWLGLREGKLAVLEAQALGFSDGSV